MVFKTVFEIVFEIVFENVWKILKTVKSMTCCTSMMKEIKAFLNSICMIAECYTS